MKKAAQPSRTSSQDQKAAINSQYTIGEKIGEGAFSKVYVGTNIKTNIPVAIKTEKTATKNQVVLYEGKVLKNLQPKGKVEGIPEMYWCGTQDRSNFMVFELLGSNLEELWKRCGKKFTLKTILLIADQVLRRIEHLHNCGYVHCDIKLANLAVGTLQNSKMIYLLDYGLCKSYKDLGTGAHKAYRENQPLKGNAVFASANAHLGIDQTRRDDLESLAYLLIYLYRGRFDWQNEQFSSKVEQYTWIMDYKMTTPPEVLCRGMPDEFMSYLTYCRGLKYSEKPNYNYLRNLFLKLAKNKRLDHSAEYDWEHLSPTELKETAGTMELRTTNSLFMYNHATTEVSDDSSFVLRHSAFRTKTVELCRLTCQTTDNDEQGQTALDDDLNISAECENAASSNPAHAPREVRNFPSKSSLMPDVDSPCERVHVNSPQDLRFMMSNTLCGLRNLSVETSQALLPLYKDRASWCKESLLHLEDYGDNSKERLILPAFAKDELGRMQRKWVSISEDVISKTNTMDIGSCSLKNLRCFV